mmetsp:Transcript_28678/g.92511  ORF Transcript_28678/g.92511 Transcript_28678/m.92511 type:complete len:90 (+) Transcript_28678:288-557(+)
MYAFTTWIVGTDGWFLELDQAACDTGMFLEGSPESKCGPAEGTGGCCIGGGEPRREGASEGTTLPWFEGIKAGYICCIGVSMTSDSLRF